MSCDAFGPEGFAFTTDIVECVEYCTANGAHVISNSYGGPGASQAMLDVITLARDAGQLFVVAAGNDGDGPILGDSDLYPNFPASYPVDNIMSIAATGFRKQLDQDALASYSNYGDDLVHMAAPGSGVLSTIPPAFGLGPYFKFSGTSMACPHVAGAAALVLSVAPDMTYADLKLLLMRTGDKKVKGVKSKTISGRRLNVAKALAKKDETFEPYPPVPISPTQGFLAFWEWLGVGASFFGQFTPFDLVARTVDMTYSDDVSGGVPGYTSCSSQAKAFPFSFEGGTLLFQIPADAADPTEEYFNLDDAAEQLNLPADFQPKFFGEPQTSVFVSVNGNLHFGVPDFNWEPETHFNTLRLSVLFHDLSIDAFSSISWKIVEDEWLVVTYLNVKSFRFPEARFVQRPALRHSFQVALHKNGDIKMYWHQVSFDDVNIPTGMVVGVSMGRVQSALVPGIGLSDLSAQQCVAPPPSSPQCCEFLSDFSSTAGSFLVCASAKIPGSDCPSIMTWTDAKGMCEGAGARLCTKEELLQGEAVAAGCNTADNPVWSSAKCGDAKFETVTGDGSAVACTSKANFARLACCADVCGSQVASCPIRAEIVTLSDTMRCQDGQVVQCAADELLVSQIVEETWRETMCVLKSDFLP